MELLFKKSAWRAIPFLTLIIFIFLKSWVTNIATPAWQIFLVYGILFLLNITALYQIYKADKAVMKSKLILAVFLLVVTAVIFIYQFNSR
jgi:hypothetical protein